MVSCRKKHARSEKKKCNPNQIVCKSKVIQLNLKREKGTEGWRGKEREKNRDRERQRDRENMTLHGALTLAGPENEGSAFEGLILLLSSEEEIGHPHVDVVWKSC